MLLFVSKVTKKFAPLQLENCIPEDNNKRERSEREGVCVKVCGRENGNREVG